MTAGRTRKTAKRAGARAARGAPQPPDPRSPAALVEELGDLFARMGAQRISGRVVGWLLVSMGIAQCEPERRRMRLAYLAAFAVILLATRWPWLEALARA